VQLVEVDVIRLQASERPLEAARILVRSNAGGPLRIQSRLRLGPATLVAMMTRSRGTCFNQRPTIVSEAPQVSGRGGTAYISAVSMKLIP